MHSPFETLFMLVLLFFFLSCSQQEQSESDKNELYVAAYVWPSCHYEARNAETLWVEGGSPTRYALGVWIPGSGENCGKRGALIQTY
jgi:hypothetical protein